MAASVRNLAHGIHRKLEEHCGDDVKVPNGAFVAFWGHSGGILCFPVGWRFAFVLVSGDGRVGACSDAVELI